MKRLLTLVAALLLATFASGLLLSCSDETIEECVTYDTRSDYGDVTILEMRSPAVVGRSVTLNAKVLNISQCGIKKVGFTYSNKNPQPEPKSGVNSMRLNAKVADDSTFTASIGNLAEGTVYYARAFAVTNAADTVYSDIFSFEAQVVVPDVNTMPVVNRARRGAVVFAKFNTAGTKSLKSWGVCIGTSPMPTIAGKKEVARDTCRLTGFQGEFGAFFQDLDPDRLYHVRAYAETADGEVYYGENRLFRTTRGGQYSWRWASNEQGARNDGAYDRITEAMDSASYYYNNYSNLYLSASVEYNTGVPTADCSWGGWIRFGSNSRYQWVGTAQHETSHGLGVGTAGNWGSLCVSGQWVKPIANRTLRAVMHDQSLTIKGDSQHFWPGGINQREEVTNGTTNSYGESIRNERMLRANAMILNAMQLDGLSGPRP